MDGYFDPTYESACLLATGLDSSERATEMANFRCMLEDASSPVTRKHQEKLFQAIIDKGHVDFGGIEKSQGEIVEYSGYSKMMEVLDTMDALAEEQKATTVKEYTDVVRSAVSNIRNLSGLYKRGFQEHNDYVMLEYNTYTYACVEATSALIYEFADYIKRPDKAVMTITLKNTTMRANLFIFEQLKKFNRVQDNMGMDYRKLLEASLSKGKNNFIGIDAAIGYGAISLVALAIVPVTRELIYLFYNIRKNLSRNLDTQALFLEMNKLSVENNTAFTMDQRKKIIDKQQKLAQQLRRVSSAIKVDSVTATRKAKKELESDNKKMAVAETRKDIEDSPIQLF
jgi:hypothetical protein